MHVFGLWEKQEYLEKTHTGTWRICKLYTEKPRFEPGTFLLWSNSADHSTIIHQAGDVWMAIDYYYYGWLLLDSQNSVLFYLQGWKIEGYARIGSPVEFWMGHFQNSNIESLKNIEFSLKRSPWMDWAIVFASWQQLCRCHTYFWRWILLYIVTDRNSANSSTSGV